MEIRPPLHLIDLFSGAGGFTLGFTSLTDTDPPVIPIWANDFNADAARTYNANFGDHCTVGDIVEILDDPSFSVPDADIVVGGPPCQGFSLLNKNRDDDPRKHLWRPFMVVVEQSGASVFVMENVQQLLGSHEHRDIVRYANDLGFHVASAKLCSADYGVPQVRHRAFVIGSRLGNPADFFPPDRTHFNPRNGNQLDAFDYVERPSHWRTVRDAVADLEPPVGTEIRDAEPPHDLHFGRNPTQKSIKRYKAIPEEGMNRFDLQERAPELTPQCWIRKKSGGTDLFGRLWWDRPSVTMRTEFFKPEKGRYLHPEQHRPITHREAARFQSFPDSFRFTGSKIEIARQIGNAVPPKLAEHIARCIHRHLTEQYIEEPELTGV